MQEQEKVIKLATKLYEHKAEKIAVLKVDHLTVLCDYMLIASAKTAAQISSLTDELEQLANSMGMTLHRSEGMHDGRWVILDYGHIMIHLFQQAERKFYDLDRLWNDGSNAVALPFDQSDAD